MLKRLKMFLIPALMLCLASVASAGSPRSFNDIIASGTLRIGVTLFPPWVMQAKDGNLIGSEIDMGRRLAADMGISASFNQYQWEELIPALNKGDIDIIVSGMGIKPNRALKVNFSRPYGDAGIGLAANTKLTNQINSLNDLKNPKVKIGFVTQTVSADLSKRLFDGATLVPYEREDQLEAALLKGDVYFVVAANPLPKFLALQNPGKIDEPLSKPLLDFKEGLAINKGDVDFLNFLDSWVVSRTADEWIPSTRKYWLETLEWKPLVK